MPADIVGTNLIVEDEAGRRQFQFEAGPIFANLVLADEINRATPKTQSAMLEAMQERSVTVAKTTRPLPGPFFVLATQNPLEMEGTYPLPEAQLDRFFFKIDVPFPSADELIEIANRTTGAAVPQAEPVADGSTILAMQSLARGVPIADHVTAYAARLLKSTHPDEAAALPALRHRLILNFEAQAEGVTTDEVIEAVLDGVVADEA
jgi:MoxR-like ATPase